MNTLYLGDCLNVLRDSVADESVDLIYIDPPFNSKRDYNIFFDDKEIQSQRLAFEDTWSLKNVLDSLHELQTMRTENIHLLLAVYQKVAPHAFPYLVMMALRIVELHRVLKPTGSFYLHCDPTMSHYLKTICDTVFGEKYFHSEIVWRRTNSHNKLSDQYGPIHDIILFYSKTSEFIFHPGTRPYSEKYIEDRFTNKDKNGIYQLNYLTGPGTRKGESGIKWKGFDPTKAGRHWAIPKSLLKYLPENSEKLGTIARLELLYKKDFIVFPKKKDGQPMYKQYVGEGMVYQDIWAYQPNTTGALYKSDECIDQDVKYLEGEDEKLGFPTQKPVGLLKRIIETSSDVGDIVLDGFCGCGTTIDAAEGLHRKWIGIDISPIAISLIKRRLHHTYKKGLAEFEVRGTPTDEQSAQRLWKENAFAFQDWWITEFEAFSSTFGTKGADKGVDGIALYAMDNKDTTARVAFQVKGGEKVQSKDIDALLGAIEKHKCDMGVFLTTAEPTKPMLDTVAGAGFVKMPGFEFPKLQILTLKDFFAGKRPKLPSTNITFKAAQHSGKKKENQEALEL